MFVVEKKGLYFVSLAHNMGGCLDSPLLLHLYDHEKIKSCVEVAPFLHSSKEKDHVDLQT